MKNDVNLIFCLPLLSTSESGLWIAAKTPLCFMLWGKTSCALVHPVSLRWLSLTCVTFCPRCHRGRSRSREPGWWRCTPSAARSPPGRGPSAGPRRTSRSAPPPRTEPPARGCWTHRFPLEDRKRKEKKRETRVNMKHEEMNLNSAAFYIFLTVFGCIFKDKIMQNRWGASCRPQQTSSSVAQRIFFSL